MRAPILEQTTKSNKENDNIILSLRFAKFDKVMIIGCVFFLIYCGGYISIIEQTIAILYVMLIILFVLFIIIMMISDRKVVFIKNESENTLTAKVYNYFGCRKRNKIFNYLNTIQFDVRIIEGEKSDYFNLFIFNNLSRLQAIYPDKNEIRIKPFKLYYYFKRIESTLEKTALIIHLNEFTNSPTGFDSPLFFDVKKYLSRDEVKYPAALYDNDDQIIFSNIMRFSKYFYTYHIRDPNENIRKRRCNKNVIILIIINIILYTIFMPIYERKLKISSLLSLLMTFVSMIFVNIIISLIINCLNYRIKRIDCIYTSDFNKIFIGTTTINEKCYKNTYEFVLSEINRFYVKENNYKTFLSVSVLNNDIDICEIINKID